MAFEFADARAAIMTRDWAALVRILNELPGSSASNVEMLADALLGERTQPIPDGLLHPAFALSFNAALLRRQGVAPAPSPTHVPVGLDFIADIEGCAAWSLDQYVNRLMLDTLPATKTAAVVGTMRDDGIYVLEWVAHYRALGFEHIFVYTNDNVDASDQLLSNLVAQGLITVFQNDVSGEVPPEAKAFGHALNLLPELRDYEWALFVDSDEFLMPAPHVGTSITDILHALAATHPDNLTAGVCYEWLWFISNAVFERQPGLLCERFQHARPHWLAKCLARPRGVLSMRRQHYPEVMPGLRFVDSLFRPLTEADVQNAHPPEYGGGRINHYWPKSFQEFAVKKARGAALARGDTENLYDRPYRSFFQWNGVPAPDNHYPTHPELIRRIRAGITELRRLPGVAEAAEQIEQRFPWLLESICPAATLREVYLANKTDPGPL